MNKLIGYFLDGHTDEIILVKVYGQKTEMMIDRQCEINTMKVNREIDIVIGNLIMNVTSSSTNNFLLLIASS